MFKKLGSKLKEQKGFTLIELLAVIVILGIIAAIAIPAIGNVISKSDKKATVQDGLLIIEGAKMYIANNPETLSATKLSTTLSLKGQAEPTGTKGALALEDYVDRVKDNSFLVTVTMDASTGTYSYSLTAHEANTVLGAKGTDADGATEQDLIEYKN
jgi:type IV pilus assembly protein PilA